ncbi:MAG: biotin/lipoyl-containing protein [Bdellovibrionales bacterium]
MKHVFDFKGRKIVYTSDWVGSQLWVHVNGKTFKVEPDSGLKKGRKRQESSGQNQVAAPMPGKVTKVLVTNSQSVKKGQAVLVMEAMKMEYTLKADQEGQIKAVKTQAGDQVALGQVLVEIEESKP